MGDVIMALYAISDLHLALTEDKPMDIFGNKWSNHHERIRENWIKNISYEDTVLIAGDISWSMKIDEGRKDLEFINELPGRKIFVRGNHDYWWTSIKKLNIMFENMDFIQNNFFTYKKYAICGSRGWTTDKNSNFSEHDEKIFQRELIRLKLSLDSAKNSGYEDIIVMLHYPPTYQDGYDTGFTKLLEEYKVKKVIYGHLHGFGIMSAYNGDKNGIQYILTSCDYINFSPIKIEE